MRYYEPFVVPHLCGLDSREKLADGDPRALERFGQSQFLIRTKNTRRLIGFVDVDSLGLFVEHTNRANSGCQVLGDFAQDFRPLVGLGAHFKDKVGRHGEISKRKRTARDACVTVESDIRAPNRVGPALRDNARVFDRDGEQACSSG
jgi:hypothetical protein